MRVFIFLLASALLNPGPALASTAREFTVLPPGRYAITLTGLVSTVCSRAIAAEWSKLPEIESASVNYAKATAHVTVRLGRTAQVSDLHKALRHAEKLANLDAHYELHDIAYQLVK